MRIILSPAKKMNQDTDSLSYVGMPEYLEETDVILSWLRERTYGELKKLWGCNDRIAQLNYDRLQKMELRRNLTPAILSYEGIAFQYMAPAVFEEGQLAYVQEHLRILSGFYGVLRPLDGVAPYRLEMQAKAKIAGYDDLYGLWGRRLYESVRGGDGVIVNLASKEYAKCIEKYLTGEDTYITCVFGEISEGKVVQKGTYAKMARGEMVRYMAEHGIENPADMRKFDRLGYVYSDFYSSQREYVFLLEKDKKN